MTTDTRLTSLIGRFPGVLNSKELLIAEAIQARAWASLLDCDSRIGAADDTAKDVLGRIVVRLMTERHAPVDALASAAIAEFERTWSGSPGKSKPGGGTS